MPPLFVKMVGGRGVDLQAGRLLVLARVRRLKLNGKRHDVWCGYVLLLEGISSNKEKQKR